MPKKVVKIAEPSTVRTTPRSWWLVDVIEERTLKVWASGPREAASIATLALQDHYPTHGKMIGSLKHIVKAKDGRSATDRMR